jgi:hypothetical protein
LVTRTLQRDLGNWESQGVGVEGCRWDLSDIENEDRQLEGGGGGGLSRNQIKFIRKTQISRLHKAAAKEKFSLFSTPKFRNFSQKKH